MRNVQQRDIAASANDVGVVFDTLASPNDLVWPSRWPRIKLDAGLSVGSTGGHGPILYTVTEYEPGRRIRLDFAPELGINGYHEFLVTPLDGVSTRITHTIDGPLSGRMRVVWPFMIRWLHEALLQDLLDNLERESSGRLRNRPARWSLWVRALRSVR